MEELANINLDLKDPIEVLRIIKSKLRLKTKDFAAILDVPVVKITKLLSKKIRLTEDQAKKLATHFDIEIFYFSRWYRIDSDPDYWNDSKIRNEIISLTNYLRLGYEKLVTENTNHPLVPIWKETWGDWINNYYCITDKNGGLSLETKEAVNYEINWLKKEKRKLHATINEIKKYEITNTTKNKPMETLPDNYTFDLDYESYKEIATELSAIYSRLGFNYPDNERAKYWEKRHAYWANYYTTVVKQGYSAFDSQSIKLAIEVDRITPEWIMAVDLEKVLNLNKKG